MQGGASSVSLPVLALQRDVRGSKWLSWLCFNVTLFLVGSAVIAPAVTTYAFAPALRLSSLQVSMLASAPLLGTAVLSIPVTLGARSLGGQLVALLLSCAVGVAMLVLAGVFQWLPLQGAGYIYPLLVVLALALGSGTATVNCGLIQCWWWAERYQGRVVGALLFSTSAGPAVFGAIAEPLVTAIGLSGLYLLWALLALSCAVLLLLLGHDPPYVQLLRAARRAQLAVEPLPPLPAGFVPREHCLRQDDIKAVAYAVWAQDIFPTRTLRADLWLSLSSARSWCVIVMADVTLGCFLGFIVWIPVFCVNVFRGVFLFVAFPPLTFPFSELVRRRAHGAGVWAGGCCGVGRGGPAHRLDQCVGRHGGFLHRHHLRICGDCSIALLGPHCCGHCFDWRRSARCQHRVLQTGHHGNARLRRRRHLLHGGWGRSHRLCASARVCCHFRLERFL